MQPKYVATAVGLFALAAACSGGSNTSQVSNGGAAASGGSLNSAGGSLNIGAGNGTGTGASTGITDAGVVTPDAACAQSSSAASLNALTMLVMMDDSGSMNDNNKWTQVATAMKAFFADPAAAGLRVGLRLFPSNEPTAGCWDTLCNMDQAAAVTACSTPLVDIAQLTAASAPADAQEAKLLAAIPAKPQPKGGNNSGGTPTYAALQGAENIAIGYAAAHPTEKVVVVFVTDGEPNGCDERIGDIAKIASDTLSAHQIETYAIGILGSNQGTMDQIAKAGGTTAGIMIGGANGATTEQDLLTAFGNIKASNVSCDFAVPPPPATLMLSFDNVNVNYTAGGGAERTLPRVQDATACGTSGGWYYDNNSAPTQIHLCASTCTTVQADTGAALQVLFSCVESQGYNPPK
jgi:Mg-chelatase subunit ChlD